MAGNPPADIVEQFKADVNSGKSNTQLCQDYGKAMSTIREWRVAVGLPSRSKKDYLNKVQAPTAEEIGSLFEHIKAQQDVIWRRYERQTDLELQIDDDKPIAVAYWGDFQLGHDGVDHIQFEKDAKTLADTDGLYIGLMGDYFSNPKNHSADRANLYTSLGARQLFEAILGLVLRPFVVKENILWAIEGCHDTRSTNDGEPYMKQFCDQYKTANLWHGGKVTLHLGGETYTIIARHKFMGESNLNTTNSHRRLKDAQGPADIYALAHKHFSEVGVRKDSSGRVIYIRSGSYQVMDDFGQRIGGFSGVPSIPITILWPSKHLVLPFEGHNFNEALMMLKALRQ